MATDSRPKNFGQVLAESLAKGLAQYHISRQEKLDAEADIGRQQMLMQQQSQERAMKLAEHKARMQDVDMQIRRNMIEMSQTPQQRQATQAALDLENRKALAEYEMQLKRQYEDDRIRQGYTPTGLKDGGMEDAKAISAVLANIKSGVAQQSLQTGRNVDIKQKNASEIARTNQINASNMAKASDGVIPPLLAPQLTDTLTGAPTSEQMYSSALNLGLSLGANPEKLQSLLPTLLPKKPARQVGQDYTARALAYAQDNLTDWDTITDPKKKEQTLNLIISKMIRGEIQ